MPEKPILGKIVTEVKRGEVLNKNVTFEEQEIDEAIRLLEDGDYRLLETGDKLLARYISNVISVLARGKIFKEEIKGGEVEKEKPKKGKIIVSS
jgi:hypothetical protein